MTLGLKIQNFKHEIGSKHQCSKYKSAKQEGLKFRYSDFEFDHLIMEVSWKP